MFEKFMLQDIDFKTEVQYI